MHMYRLAIRIKWRWWIYLLTNNAQIQNIICKLTRITYPLDTKFLPIYNYSFSRSINSCLYTEHMYIYSTSSAYSGVISKLTSPGYMGQELPSLLLALAMSLVVVSNLRAMLTRVSHSIT